MRYTCGLLGQERGILRHASVLRSNEDTLTRAIITLASQYGRYHYRLLTLLLGTALWQEGKDRVCRIWRRAGLKVRRK